MNGQHTPTVRRYGEPFFQLFSFEIESTSLMMRYKPIPTPNKLRRIVHNEPLGL